MICISRSCLKVRFPLETVLMNDKHT
jgi:hypothetical protein